jgi:hypothetical protein
MKWSERQQRMPRLRLRIYNSSLKLDLNEQAGLKKSNSDWFDNRHHAASFRGKLHAITAPMPCTHALCIA